MKQIYLLQKGGRYILIEISYLSRQRFLYFSRVIYWTRHKKKFKIQGNGK